MLDSDLKPLTSMPPQRTPTKIDDTELIARIPSPMKWDLAKKKAKILSKWKKK